MIIREFYKERLDGVKLFRWLDAKVGANNEPIRDEDGNLIPTGFYIRQNETGIEYTEAIDIENAPYTYAETDHLVEVELYETDLTLEDNHYD